MTTPVTVFSYPSPSMADVHQPVAKGQTLPLFQSHDRLCFYPSSGGRALDALMQLDCDLFVMADKCRQSVSWSRIETDFKRAGQSAELLHESALHLCFRVQHKTAWIFFEDNNKTLRRLALAGLRIHHFFGICDGCAEGGNHECVHERPFLSHVLQLAGDCMSYTTDHSRPLEERPYGWGCGIPVHPRFRYQMLWADFPEPPEHQKRCGLDGEQPVSASTRFELQGVLVAPNRQSQHPVRKADLRVLPTGEFQTQLNRLAPFRTRLGRGILAEYRVHLILTTP